MSEDSLAVDLADTWILTHQDLPQLAGDIARGSNGLDRAGGTAFEAMGSLWGPWEELSGALQQAIARTSTHLYSAADVLHDASQHFADLDGVNGAWLREIGEAIDEPGLVTDVSDADIAHPMRDPRHPADPTMPPPPIDPNDPRVDDIVPDLPESGDTGQDGMARLLAEGQER